MIEIEDLYKIYGSRPGVALELLRDGASKEEIHEKTSQVVGVDDVSFKLEPKEIFVVMGLSGSGKSTLLRCVNRLINPTSGKIFIDVGEGGPTEITGLGKKELRRVRREKMSMVFQHFALLPYRTVLENTGLGLKIKGQPEKQRKQEAKAVLDLVGLGKWADSKPPELSGGMRQRVGLARALATDAPVLLMDEPFSALDPLIRFNMQDELLRLQEELKRTILFVTHDLGEALRVGKRIAIMNEGKIVQTDTPEQIVINPQTEYVSKFVENADPTDVVTAEKLVKVNSSKVENQGLTHIYEFGDRRKMKCYLAEDEKMRKCLIDDAEMPINQVMDDKDLPGRYSDGVRLNEVFAIGKSTTLREAIRVKKISPFPLIVLSENETFAGIIRDEDIFNGILKENRN